MSHRLAAYRAREHAVGTLAFDARADVEVVSEHLSAFLRAFCPPDGLRVRAARGTKQEILPSRFTRTASVRAAQLARGGTIEMSNQHFEPVNGRCLQPLFWIVSRPPIPGDEDGLVPLEFGFCIARPGADAPEGAIAHALQTFVEACVQLEGCVSAIVTAQGPPITLASPSLAYEAIAGTASNGTLAGWLGAHVRSPGWLVLVPLVAARELSRKAPAGITVERVRSGRLARLDAATPFAMTSTEPMEQWLLPLLPLIP